MRRSVIVVFLFYLTQTINTEHVQNYSSFGYSFPVNYTEKCPRTAEEWDNSSLRLNCNKTYGYHCVPDKNYSSLIEFCYPRGERIMFEKGNCLELADVGILNHVNCGNFSYGCPDKDYPSNEIYKYPSCLSIVANCFTADVECLSKKCCKQGCNGVPKTEDRSTDSPCKDHIFVPLFGVSFALLVISVVCNIWQCRQRRTPFEMESQERDTLLEEDTTTGNRRPEEEQDEEYHTEDTTTGNRRPTEEQDEDAHTGNRRSEKEEDEDYPALLEKEILVDYAIQDAELFQLLKLQCKNGVYKGFHYLVKSRITTKRKEYIFRQRDENGCTLLHYAAQGGSITILKEILDYESIDVNIKCYRGQTILHYAIRHKQKQMSEYLINQYKNNLLKEFTRSSGEESEMSSSKDYFEPLHWVAWIGDRGLLAMLKNAGIDTKRLTRNDLNILDIACLGNEKDFCEHILENEHQIKLDKKDACGWNIAHYAARSNNVEVLELLCSKNESLITDRRNEDKTPLHIACEYAQFEAVEYLTDNYESLLQLTDERKWNALHYATKGGNIRILKFLLNDRGMKINSIAEDGKNLLHVACIHKHEDICRYIADIFSKEHSDLIHKTTNQGWLPAHYVGVERKEDGSEESIMDILLSCGMTLSKRNKTGDSVLDVAIDHLNKRLVKHLVTKKYRAALGISRKSLEKLMKDTKDSDIKEILQDALHEVKRDSE